MPQIPSKTEDQVRFDDPPWLKSIRVDVKALQAEMRALTDAVLTLIEAPKPKGK